MLGSAAPSPTGTGTIWSRFQWLRGGARKVRPSQGCLQAGQRERAACTLSTRGTPPGTGQPPKAQRALSCPGHRSPEGGEGGWRGEPGPHRQPRAAAEPVSRTIRKEVSTAQLSQSTKRKEKKKRKKKRKEAQGWAPPTHAGRSTTDLFTARPQPAAAREKANRKPQRPSQRGEGQPCAERAGCGRRAGRLWGRRRSEHHGTQAPRPGCAGRPRAARRDTPAKRAPRAEVAAARERHRRRGRALEETPGSEGCEVSLKATLASMGVGAARSPSLGRTGSAEPAAGADPAPGSPLPAGLSRAPAEGGSGAGPRHRAAAGSQSPAGRGEGGAGTAELGDRQEGLLHAQASASTPVPSPP
ncbi:uncharacterized protein VSU04_013834 [Chlamydotis macqueenii]